MLVNGDRRWAQMTSPAAAVPSQHRLAVAVLAQVCTVHIHTVQLTGSNGLFFHPCLREAIGIARPTRISDNHSEELS